MKGNEKEGWTGKRKRGAKSKSSNVWWSPNIDSSCGQVFPMGVKGQARFSRGKVGVDNKKWKRRKIKLVKEKEEKGKAKRRGKDRNCKGKNRRRKLTRRKRTRKTGEE